MSKFGRAKSYGEKTIGTPDAGAVALYHIAAAAAREGKSLDEVAAIAQRYAGSMASVTVKSTDATHPQNAMSFGDLGETDLMEIGAGQHGEGGGVRVPMMSSRDTVATVAQALCRNLELKAGDKAFVMINGCGATTMMEMLVLFKDTGGVPEGHGRGGCGQHGGRDPHGTGGGRLPDEHRQVGRGVHPPVEHPLPHPRLQQGVRHSPGHRQGGPRGLYPRPGLRGLSGGQTS